MIRGVSTPRMISMNVPLLGEETKARRVRDSEYDEVLNETERSARHMLTVCVASLFVCQTVKSLFPSFCTLMFDDPAPAIGWGTFGFFVFNAGGNLVVPAFADEYGFSKAQLYTCAVSAFFLLWQGVSTSFVQLVVPSTLSGAGFANSALTLAYFNLVLPYASALRMSSYVHVATATSVSYGSLLSAWATTAKFGTGHFKCAYLICSLVAFGTAIYVHNMLHSSNSQQAVIAKQRAYVDRLWLCGDTPTASLLAASKKSRKRASASVSSSKPSSSRSKPGSPRMGRTPLRSGKSPVKLESAHLQVMSDSERELRSHRRSASPSAPLIRRNQLSGGRVQGTVRRARFRDETLFPIERELVGVDAINATFNESSPRWWQLPKLPLWRWIHVLLASAQAFCAMSIISVASMWLPYFMRHKYGVSAFASTLLWFIAASAGICGILFVTDFLSFLDARSPRPHHPVCLPRDTHGFLYGNEKLSKSLTGLLSLTCVFTCLLLSFLPSSYWWIWFLVIAPMGAIMSSFVMLCTVQVMAVQPPAAVGKINGLRVCAEVLGTAIMDVVMATLIDTDLNWFLYLVALAFAAQFAVMILMFCADLLRISLSESGYLFEESVTVADSIRGVASTANLLKSANIEEELDCISDEEYAASFLSDSDTSQILLESM